MYIVKANYIDGYRIELTFDDNTIRTIDFSNELNKIQVPEYKKYLDFKYFKKFKIDMGNIVWGKNWDLVFPLPQLYKGKLAD